jgi:drug/metabolite transporter (DMT)-like permease
MDRLTAHARKALTISIGIVLLVVGVALLILPGPGIPLILVGLTLLGAHFAWARKLRTRAVDLGKQGLGRVKRLRSSLFRPRATANRPPP